MRFLLVLFTIAIAVSSPTFAVVEQVEFKDQKTEQRYKKLIAELRCLVCQNQNLADSDADLAKDLRRKTVEMLKSGASDNDIRQYMRDRYGDFVLYNPPFNYKTAFLWLSPILLLILVVAVLVYNIKKRQEDEILKPAKANNEAERVKVRNILRDAPQLNSELDTSDKDKS